MRAGVAGLLLLSLLGGCDATREGRDAWREGRPEDAYRAFAREISDAGEDASPELLYDGALAALQTARLGEAEKGARAAAARGGAPFAGPTAFVRGNVGYLRSEAAEEESKRPGGDPKAFEAAVMFAEDALAAWQVAAMSRSDWPRARRNVERGRRRLESLRERRKAGRRGPEARPGTSPTDSSSTDENAPPTPSPGPDPATPPLGPDDQPEEPGRDVASSELPPGEVRRVLDAVRAKEREKRAARRAERRSRAADVERDW